MAQPVGASAFVSRLVSVKAAREARWSFAMLSPTSSQRSCRAVWAAPVLAARACRSAGSTGRSRLDRKSTRLNSSHGYISYAVFCLKKKKNTYQQRIKDDLRIDERW